jgi:hypothetical protein
VELHEPEVLEGMGKYLYESRAAIIIEVLTSEVAKKIQSILKGAKYKYYSLSNQDIKQVEELIPNETVFNYLLIPAEKKLTDVI